jgi:flagellar motor switch/type III secretory pathway protein FliN
MSEPVAKNASERLAGFDSVPVRITIRVGFGRCSLGFLSALAEGDLIRLDRQVGSTFDLLAGERLLGHVEPVADGDGIAIKLVAVAEEEDDASR